MCGYYTHSNWGPITKGPSWKVCTKGLKLQTKVGQQDAHDCRCLHSCYVGSLFLVMILLYSPTCTGRTHCVQLHGIHRSSSLGGKQHQHGAVKF